MKLDRRKAPTSATHRDGEGQKKVARDYPSLVERLIQEAQEQGKFDHLPGRCKPLQLDDDRHAGEWALAFRILKNANVAPPWIEADKEVRHLRGALDRLLERSARASLLMRGRYRRELGQLVEAHNRAVEQVNAYAPTERQHRRRLVLENEMQRLEEAFGKKQP